MGARQEGLSQERDWKMLCCSFSGRGRGQEPKDAGSI